MIHRQLPDGIRFSVVPDSATLDFRLSHLDHRVLTHLLSKTEDWKVYATYVSETFKISDKTARNVLLNIINLGYGEPIYKNGHRVDIEITPVIQAPLVSNLPHPHGIQSTAPPGNLDTSAETPRYSGDQTPGKLDTTPPVIQIPTLVSNLPPTEQGITEQGVTQSELLNKSAPEQSQRPLTSKLEPGTYINGKGGISYTDDEAGAEAYGRMTRRLRFNEPTVNAKPISGLIRPSNVHQYRKAL